MTRKTYQKYFAHPLQGIIAHIILFLMGLIPVDLASAMGGWIGRKIGPRLRVHQIAKDNLEKAFPKKSADEINTILNDMWDNIGRVGFEFGHISKMNVYDNSDRFEIVGGEYIDRLNQDEKCGIFVSGHLANWEFMPPGTAQRNPPLPVHMIYREPDNPWMRKLFAKRKATPECGLIPKGAKGARLALEALKAGKHLAILVDQKMNDGIAVPFFGRDAMTPPAMAQFALKYDCPVVPVRIERIKGVKFKLTFYPPIEIQNTGNRKEDILAIMTDINKMLEGWVIERPDQWLWVHRRWPKD